MENQVSNDERTTFAMHVEEMRNLQIAYFASKKSNRYGDKKLLAASKAKELEVDAMIKQITGLDQKNTLNSPLSTVN